MLVYEVNANMLKYCDKDLIRSSSLAKIEGPRERHQEELLQFHLPESEASSLKNKEKYLQIIDQIQEGFGEEVTSKKSDAYYRVKNHHELYELGSSFDKDLQDGKRVFSFAGVAAGASLSRTILGIAAHFEYHQSRNVVIVADDKQFFDQYFKNSNQVSIKNFCDEDFREEEIVLWKMPEHSNILGRVNEYYPSLGKVDSCSLIVASDLTSYREIDEVINFYSKYSIEIKGIVLDQGKSSS